MQAILSPAEAVVSFGVMTTTLLRKPSIATSLSTRSMAVLTFAESRALATLSESSSFRSHLRAGEAHTGVCGRFPCRRWAKRC